MPVVPPIIHPVDTAGASAEFCKDPRDGCTDDKMRLLSFVGQSVVFLLVAVGCARVRSGGVSPPTPPAKDAAANGGPMDALDAAINRPPAVDAGAVDACAMAIAAGSTQGCDFYALTPPPIGSALDGSCFVAMLANTWTAPVAIQVAYGGQALDVARIARVPIASGMALSYEPLPGGQLAPGQMALLFLANGPVDSGSPLADMHVDCPVPAGVTVDPAVHGTGFGKPFRITTSAPVAAYDIYPYGGASSHISSATLLIPTSAWGTNYIAAAGYTVDADLHNQHSVNVVAIHDGTEVTINPTAPIVGAAGVPGGVPGQPRTYNLASGQMLQLLQPLPLSGSAISANKVVGVWGGTTCMNIPVGWSACDSAHQQLVPVNLLGFEYTAVSYRDRLAGKPETVPWTVIGAVDGTTLRYDPAPPRGAPGVLNRGETVELDATAPFNVRSQDAQHPFYLAGHMTGWLKISDDPGPGDPETVNTVPPQQWRTSYTFLTDATYSNSHLVFTRQKMGGTFYDVTLDCLGTLGGWAPIGG
ncbi:MAG: hypothetical protein QOI66_3150, partial [Myxococcales bacterium]|nr:hypothetical protein [Myxococcales bacterium]